MITYWDLSERERSELTEADVEKFTAAELMRKGIQRVKPPELEIVPKATAPDCTLFAVELGQSFSPKRLDALFASADDARKAVDAIVGYVNHDWYEGTSVDYAEMVDGEPRIAEVRIFSRDTRKQHAEALRRRATVIAKNQERVAEYDAALKVEREALAGVWADWHDCRSKAQKLRRVVETWSEYVEIAGDAKTAATFLRKAVSAVDVADAIAWFGLPGYDASGPWEPEGIGAVSLDERRAGA